MNSLEDMTLYIPTAGRALKQETLKWLPASVLERTWLLIDADDMDTYDHQTIYLPEDCKGIHSIRQWMIDNCPTPFVFMADDDMKFFKRMAPDSWKLQEADPVEIEELFETLLDWLCDDGFGHVGLSARQGNNRVEEACREVIRQNNFHGYDVELMRFLGVRFDRLKVMEDFDVTLQLLRLGFPNRVMYRYCWNQLGSGAEGGCSTYRTGEVQAEAAHQLKEFHGDFVRVTEKESKSGWHGLSTRTDVVIQWKKAYVSSGATS